MKNIYTLEIEEKTKDGKQITLQVDYDKDFMIHDIYAWSEYFSDFIPVQLSWLLKFKKPYYETIYEAIRTDYAEKIEQRRKDLELSIYLGK